MVAGRAPRHGPLARHLNSVRAVESRRQCDARRALALVGICGQLIAWRESEGDRQAAMLGEQSIENRVADIDSAVLGPGKRGKAGKDADAQDGGDKAKSRPKA